jgi:2-dehydro-3-deoxy-D-arabinonate dehydratase
MDKLTEALPPLPALVRVCDATGASKLSLWLDGRLHDLTHLPDPAGRTLDGLLTLRREHVRALLEDPANRQLPVLDPSAWELSAPVESQEVWASGVTYRQSREARIEESVAKDVYAMVYEASRPELFFKAAGWRVVPHGGTVGIRSDSEWDVPEPELAVLSNAHGEIVAYSCGNDMSSRSIEGLNPLYLPQAKVYDDSCSIGPAAVLAWHVDPSRAEIRMTIEREGTEVFSGSATVADLVREPAQLVGVLHGAYTLPAGAWLLTGTSIVPPAECSVLPGDVVRITIEGIGRLQNQVKRVMHSGAQALPRVGARGAAQKT